MSCEFILHVHCIDMIAMLKILSSEYVTVFRGSYLGEVFCFYDYEIWF